MTGRKGEEKEENFQLTISGAKMIYTIISLLLIIFYFFQKKFNFNIKDITGRMISGLVEESALSGHTGKYEISFDFLNGRHLSATTGLLPLKEFPLCNCPSEFIVRLPLKILRKEISFYRMRTGEYTEIKKLILIK